MVSWTVRRRGISPHREKAHIAWRVVAGDGFTQAAPTDHIRSNTFSFPGWEGTPIGQVAKHTALRCWKLHLSDAKVQRDAPKLGSFEIFKTCLCKSSRSSRKWNSSFFVWEICYFVSLFSTETLFVDMAQVFLGNILQFLSTLFRR